MDDVGGYWCILRTASRSTLKLAESLAEDGYEVWTPIETREPPKDAKKSKAKDEPEQRAILPTFLFAGFSQVSELVALSRSPSLHYRVWDSEKRRMVVKGHAAFSIFRHNGAYSRIPDFALSSLRAAERRRKPRGLVKMFEVGAKVKLTEGVYTGLKGEVVAVKGKIATVAFPKCGFVRDAQCPMWVLLDDEPQNAVNAHEIIECREAA